MLPARNLSNNKVRPGALVVHIPTKAPGDTDSPLARLDLPLRARFLVELGKDQRSVNRLGLAGVGLEPDSQAELQRVDSPLAAGLA